MDPCTCVHECKCHPHTHTYHSLEKKLDGDSDEVHSEKTPLLGGRSPRGSIQGGGVEGEGDEEKGEEHEEIKVKKRDFQTVRVPGSGSAVRVASLAHVIL